jgi:hypothetical protein
MPHKNPVSAAAGAYATPVHDTPLSQSPFAPLPRKQPRKRHAMTKPFDLVIHGATGFTGRLVVEYLLQRYPAGSACAGPWAGAAPKSSPPYATNWALRPTRRSW